MMTRLLFHIAAICLLSIEGLSQSGSSVSSVTREQESISIHLNTDLFLTGESLLFKVNCLQTNSGKLSNLSKLAYLELIDEKGQAVAQMKVTLGNGRGDGTYYIEPALPTGNYTLIAYTRWMRNFGSDHFYRKTIKVINPALIEPGQKSANASPIQTTTLPEDQPASLEIKIDKQQYKERERIVIQLAPPKHDSAAISINVRRQDKSIDAFADAHAESNLSNIAGSGDYTFLPDLRGELITGIVKDKAGKPLANEIISLSATPFFWLSRTDSTGRFFFNIKSVQTNYTLLKPLHRRVDDVSISVDDPFLGSYKAFTPEKLQIDTALLHRLSQRYVSSQVQNVFRVAHKDSVVKDRNTSRFITSPDRIYRLDDFTRFPTMDDVFREIIPEVIVKAQNGHYSLSMRNVVTGERFYKEPLALIDGIPITDADVLMRYDPLLIDKIVIVARRYYFGPLETEGIISIETYKRNAEDLVRSEFIRNDFIKPLTQTPYYFPTYDGASDLTRIPDFRTQLYWNPDISVSKPVTLSFFANDLPGTYQIEIEGISSEGERISIRRLFTIGN
jgi:hypothetical protein